MWFIDRRAVTKKKGWYQRDDLKLGRQSGTSKPVVLIEFVSLLDMITSDLLYLFTNRGLLVILPTGCFKKINKDTTIGEVMKLFGIWALTTQFDFWYRSFLWSKTDISNYLSAPYFGDNVMPYHGFDTLWKCIRFLDQINTNL